MYSIEGAGWDRVHAHLILEILFAVLHIQNPLANLDSQVG